MLQKGNIEKNIRYFEVQVHLCRVGIYFTKCGIKECSLVVNRLVATRLVEPMELFVFLVFNKLFSMLHNPENKLFRMNTTVWRNSFSAKA